MRWGWQLPGVFQPTAVGDFRAIAPETAVDAGVKGNGIGGFDFDISTAHEVVLVVDGEFGDDH